VAGGRAVISTQVLEEYFAVVTRKLSVAAEAAQKKGCDRVMTGDLQSRCLDALAAELAWRPSRSRFKGE